MTTDKVIHKRVMDICAQKKTCLLAFISIISEEIPIFLYHKSVHCMFWYKITTKCL